MSEFKYKDDIQSVLATSLPWEKFSQKNILLTGASGMLGSYIAFTLLSLSGECRPKKIFLLGRNKNKMTERFKQFLDQDNLELLIQDVASPIELEEELHYIIHGASPASPQVYGADPLGTISANSVGTNNLLQLACHKKVESFLFISSSEVYGKISHNEPINEADYGYLDCLQVRACYAESKRLGENLCVSWHHQYGVPAKIVRPFHTYGPTMSLDDGRVYADFVKNIVNGENISLNSDGSAQRTFCYITDATSAFFLVLLKAKDAEAYNMGFPEEEYSIAELARTVASLVPGRMTQVSTKVKEKSEGYIQSSVNRNLPSIKKLNDLGWNPSVTVREGFKKTIESFL